VYQSPDPAKSLSIFDAPHDQSAATVFQLKFADISYIANPKPRINSLNVSGGLNASILTFHSTDYSPEAIMFASNFCEKESRIRLIAFSYADVLANVKKLHARTPQTPQVLNAALAVKIYLCAVHAASRNS
jgi:hypothetical protein